MIKRKTESQRLNDELEELKKELPLWFKRGYTHYTMSRNPDYNSPSGRIAIWNWWAGKSANYDLNQFLKDFIKKEKKEIEEINKKQKRQE